MSSSKTAFSIRVYSFYLFTMGAALMAVPNLLLGLFGFPPTQEIWIRMLGLFTFTAGIYYFQASANEQTAFFKATVAGRIFFFMVTCIFTVLFKQPPMLALVGSIDLLGAAWTYFTIKKG